MLPNKQLAYAAPGTQDRNFTNLTKFSVDVDRDSMTVLVRELYIYLLFYM